MTHPTVVQAINETLRSEMARDDRIMLLGQDIGKLGGVFRATAGLQEEFGEERVIDTPLAEGAIVGASIGLAVAGLVPVAEIQFLGFAQQAFHQISQQLARVRLHAQGRYSAPVTLRAAYGSNVNAPELHSDSIEALFAHIPGLKVVVPSIPSDAAGLLRTAIRDPDPVIFLEPLGNYRKIRGEVPGGDHLVPLGSLRVARDGSDVTLVAWSAAVQLAEKAADVVAQEGISTRVLDLRSLVPLDLAGLHEHVEATGRCVVVQEASLTCSFGSEIAATIQEDLFFSLEAPVARVSSPDAPHPIPGLEPHFSPTVEHLVDAIRRTVSI